MKNACNDSIEAKVAERNERAKKLYRYVTDVARRIGDTTSGCHSMSDLFSTNLELQRQKLRDNCEKLLFLDSANYGKKTLELLWRKVYYETVSTAKKLRESDNENDSYLFTHIICGIGHFHHFLTRIQSEIKINCKDLDYTILHQDEETEDNLQIPNDDELQLGRSLLYSCLIYLGDLSRYQVELFQSLDPSIAARYYLQAAQIDLCSGMPYNQLGNLYMDKNYNLDSVCYYIHCLSCETPFDGAMGNLTKIFEKNSLFYETLQCSETATQTEHIQNTIANFLSLIEIWYSGKNDTNIPQRCSAIAQQVKMCLDFVRPPLPDMNKDYNEYIQAVEEESVNPSFLNTNLVHKIVQICLFTSAKMIESDEAKAFACKAFTLALLLQLLQKLLKQVESIGLQNPASKYRPKVKPVEVTEVQESDEKIELLKEETDTLPENINGMDTDSCEEIQTNNKIPDGDLDKLQNGDGKNIKKSSKRRRRRRLASSGSSDISNAETESSELDSEESCSDEEEYSESSYQSDDDSKSDGTDFELSDGEKVNEKPNGDINHENVIKEPKDTNGCIDNSVKTNTENLEDNEKKLNEDDLKLFLLGNNFLPSIKLLQDWILTEKDLILSCGDSGEALFQCVVDLLNIFTYYFNSKMKDINENKNCKVLDYAKYIARKLKLEYKTIPLPEDINLRGTNICKYDKHAAEWQILDCYNPSVYEENVIRILNFIDFGNQIAKLVPRIRFNRSMKIFYVKKVQPPKINTKINHKRNREWHNSKKPHPDGSEGGLLRRLGKLWLASQVRELERSGQAAAPALLALDTAALNKHLRRVKQLLRTRNFVFLVPTVVLQELDELKREQSTARDAIRWLEIQLRNSSRFLRAQRPGQSRSLPLLKYPRKAPPHVHNFIQILEFCNHFIGDEKQSQGGNGDPDTSLPGKSAPLLILLVGNDPGGSEEQYKEFSLTGAAQAAGISIENIGDFYSKWRQTALKNGKKR